MNRALRRFRANRGAIVGAILVALLVVIAVIAPHVTANDPITPDIDHGLTAMGAPVGPSGNALLGTDQLGRDVWARLVAGAGASLTIAALATMIALVIGLGVGLLAGYAGGWVDSILMRFVDLVLSFPFLLLAILLAALLREAGMASTGAPVFLTLGLVGWTTMARVIRGKAMALAHSEMITAARTIGASPVQIITRHILPNVLGLVVVLAALNFAQNLVAESVLSYLGLGPPPPAPSWGRMLFEGQGYYRTAPRLVLAPGLAILLAVAAFQLVSEGLRDALDPKESR